MVQFKLQVFVAFVLAAGAMIAPVVALPVTLLVENRSVLYVVIGDYYLLIVVYCSVELNARDDSDMFERDTPAVLQRREPE